MRKTVSATLLFLLLVGTLTLAFDIEPVKAWTGTVYIRADGSIDPPDAPIVTADNITYTLTADIYGSVVVERDNIVVDGKGYALQGTGTGNGVDLSERKNVTVKNTKIQNFRYGVWLRHSSNNTISGNNITNNEFGIYLEYSSNNVVSGNNATNNSLGIFLSDSLNNTLTENTLMKNSLGLEVRNSYNNTLTENTLMKNSMGLEVSNSYNNTLTENRVQNNFYGIHLWMSRGNNTLRHNIMLNNTYNFGVSGGAPEDIDTSNTVDGKPIYYWSNARDLVVPSDAGYVALINSTNIIVKDLNLKSNGQGILLVLSRNSTITNNTITNNYNGITLDYYSSNNIIQNNTVTDNWFDNIILVRSFNNVIMHNKLTKRGLRLSFSSNNTIVGNNFTNMHQAINVYSSFDNSIYHNNFVNITEKPRSIESVNVWDSGYPSGGNYWSDYAGVDADVDGIGDEPYAIDANNTDRYPLMAPFNTFYAGVWNDTAYNVDIVTNSTVSSFQVDTFQKTMSFNVTGVEGKAGFCRITIPNIIAEDLWQGNYTVLLNGEPWPFRNWTDTTNTYIYINYTHSEHEIVIVPEFPSAMILPIFMFLAMLSAVLARKRHPRKNNINSNNHLFSATS